uniref:Retrovirus-related Pol polyprotein from transposon TNT 1-94 n=1 Tax=Cajanus cajan TaxID=3821 RepID=A0A151SF56_CAJCA|nr:Retrovirus-related Pol polyprotein from transposon TNT 1-94 [Cajanus cajan]
MKEYETVKDYYSKIKEIVNQMRAYGENIFDKKIMEKILISIPYKYNPIVTTIEKTKDLSTISITKLMRSLEAYEKRLNRHDEDPTENVFQSKRKLQMNILHAAFARGQIMSRKTRDARDKALTLWHRRFGHFNMHALKLLYKKKMTWVYFVLGIFKKFKTLNKKQSGKQIKVLRSDRGKEYISHEFHKFYEDGGIERQLIVAYSPQQNGVSKRKNHTIMEMVRSMLKEKGLPNTFWAETIYIVVYILNRCPTKIVQDKNPIEA